MSTQFLDKTGLTYFWGKLKDYFQKKQIWYGTCTTGASTQTKVVTTTSGDFVLAAGNIVYVEMSNSSQYSGVSKLNVDGTGAKEIYDNRFGGNTNGWWLSGEIVEFVYDGTDFIMVDKTTATTTDYGLTKLSSSTSSISESLAATPKAVKEAYDLANGKQDALVSGTNIKTINGNSLLGSGDITIGGGGTFIIGEIKSFAGDSSMIPSGWLECDGSEVLISQYTALYAVLTNIWGTPSDQDHFVLPDLRGRVPLGAGLGTASDATSRVVGKMGGSERVTLTEDQMPTHTHIQNSHGHNLGNIKYGSGYCASGNRSGVGQNSAATSTIYTSGTTATNQNAGGGQSHGNVQPYATVTFMIYAGV